MKKSLKGSRWFLLLIAITLCLPLVLDLKPAQPVEVSNIEWDCKKPPCRVGFDLEKAHTQPVDVVVEIRGYNHANDLALPRPRILVGKREFKEHLGTERKKHFAEEVKFTRYPDEIEIVVRMD